MDHQPPLPTSLDEVESVSRPIILTLGIRSRPSLSLSFEKKIGEWNMKMTLV